MHPFAPSEQAAGYLDLIGGLEAALAEITGYDAVSLQPNAGSQGELAGLLAIRHYHASRGEPARDVCLIPESAHGTNAASAVLAGLRVAVVKCGHDGAIDVGDLRAKLDAHAGSVAAIMLTYPSTNGVFEETVGQVCAEVHDAGGQVYVDGANLNALVGLARPGTFGADVSHLNLHKTFCIPHGGGGPGVGPVACRAHLAPFLPGHPELPARDKHTGPVAAAPYGSAGILPISWAYIRMMGAEGLRRATGVAILSANYVARRLDPHFPVLYTGRDGLVAHECILDLRPITSQTGITAEDVAKRLIDYGGGWTYGVDPYPTGDQLFATGSGSNASNYSSPEADKIIAATVHGPGTLTAYENYAADQIPVLWMPQSVYQISEISKNLHGTSPQSPIEGLTPENWYLTK
jgi:glycine dehydrogenase